MIWNAKKSVTSFSIPNKSNYSLFSSVMTIFLSKVSYKVVLYKFWSKLHANSCFANFFKNRTRKQTNMLKHFLHQASVRLGCQNKNFFFNIRMFFIQGDIWHYITSASEILPLLNYLSVNLPSKKVSTQALLHK